MSGVALITGGQRGIGLGIAKVLHSAGFKLALVAEVPQHDTAVQAVLNELGRDVGYFQHDLRDIDAISQLLDAVESQLGRVTTLISNAGVPARKRGDLFEVQPQDFDFTMDINLRGTFFLAQALAKRMLDRPRESYQSLVFVTSVSATMVSVERAEYCISKAAASMMAQLFAARLAADGIGVFELRPGIIATPMTAPVAERYDAAIEAGLVPAKRWGRPDDIAQAVLPLVTGQMAFANGAIVPVDGGLSLHRL